MFLATSGIFLTPLRGVSLVLSSLFSPETLRVPDKLSSYAILAVSCRHHRNLDPHFGDHGDHSSSSA
jgi:hypothetical protein